MLVGFEGRGLEMDVDVDVRVVSKFPWIDAVADRCFQYVLSRRD